MKEVAKNSPSHLRAHFSAHNTAVNRIPGLMAWISSRETFHTHILLFSSWKITAPHSQPLPVAWAVRVILASKLDYSSAGMRQLKSSLSPWQGSCRAHVVMVGSGVLSQAAVLSGRRTSAALKFIIRSSSPSGAHLIDLCPGSQCGVVLWERLSPQCSLRVVERVMYQGATMCLQICTLDHERVLY